MELSFANRAEELKELDSAADAGGLMVVFGRRRVGKTRLLAHWLKPRDGLYSQAIEASGETQLEQVFHDLRDRLATQLVPKTWSELFELLGLQKKRLILCLDEFPYLAASDPSLPSVLQRWLDHGRPAGFLLILAGSSTRMMNALFLNRSAPLYGRARKLLHIRPMSYSAFCSACRLDPSEMESFTRFSLVGGIPKYWEFVDPKASAIDLANELFFGFIRTEPAGQGDERAVVSEVKWKSVSASERKKIENQLADAWKRSVLARRFPTVRFEVLDASALKDWVARA